MPAEFVRWAPANGGRWGLNDLEALTRDPDRAPSSWGLGDGQAIPWEYAPAPESRDVVTLKERYGLFINGKDVPASDGQVFTSVNPATEEPLAEVARATAADMASWLAAPTAMMVVCAGTKARLWKVVMSRIIIDRSDPSDPIGKWP